MKELAVFYSQSVKEGDSLTFVEWYFDDISDLRKLGYPIPGIIVFAHSDFKELTTISDVIQLLFVFQTENVKVFIHTLTPEMVPEANIILVRQQDNVTERENEFNKMKIGL